MNCLLGISNHTGGGVVIFEKIKEEILRSEANGWLIIYPTGYKGERQNELIIPNCFRTKVLFPVTYSYYLPRFLNSKGIAKVLNLSDIPLRFRKKQYFLFDWPYLAYPEVKIKMSLAKRTVFLAKKRLFRLNYKFVDHFLFQHEAIRERIDSRYLVKKYSLLPNGINELKFSQVLNVFQDKSIKVLVLSKAYPHKRLERIRDLHAAIKELGYMPKIKITISEREGGFSRQTVNMLWDLEGVEFIGNKPLDEIPGYYGWCNLLFLPSDLESFSGLLVESIYYKRPILCKSLDFNSEVAGGNAYMYDSEISMKPTLSRLIRDVGMNRVNFSYKKKYYRTWNSLSEEIVNTVDSDL